MCVGHHTNINASIGAGGNYANGVGVAADGAYLQGGAAWIGGGAGGTSRVIQMCALTYTP
jgi:hypothetical protein